jgi:hypothetical protein
MYVLALGPEPTVARYPLLYEAPYTWLMRLPGFDVLRVPARFAMAAVLCQSVLVALAVRSLESSKARGHRADARDGRAPAPAARSGRAAAALVCLGLLLDGWIGVPVVAAPSSGPLAFTGADAVLHLPAGTPEDDFPAIYRAMRHGLPIVNGYSGYAPPHYIPLAHAIRDGHYGAVAMVAAFGRIAVTADLSSPAAVERLRAIEAAVSGGPSHQSSGALSFVVDRLPLEPVRAGDPVRIAHIEANRHAAEVGRMLDGRVDTAWGSGAAQGGGETVVVDLGAPTPIAAVVLRMGSFAFGFPRDLVVDLSLDGVNWSRAFEGSTDVQTVRAALLDPSDVPVTIDLGRVSTRYVRLQQRGREPGIPWWIGELQVLAP